MPSFDFPIEELRTYQGITPKPEDFDQYWKDALAELDATPPCATLTPSSFKAKNADCFDLTFNGVRGARIYAKYLRPKTAGKHPCILQFHGYKGSSAEWCDKLSYVANDCCVAALDVRGQGGKSQDPGGVTGNTQGGHIIRGLQDAPQDLFFRHVFLDTVQLARVVAALDEVDETRLGAMGNSQGGALAIACSALAGNIKRTAVQHPFLSDYKRVWQLDLDTTAYAELYEYFCKFDPCHERETEIFERLGYIDVQNLAPYIQHNVLLSIGLVDKICPPSTQFAAYNHLTCEKELVVYPDFGHEFFPHWPDKMFAFFADL